MCIHSQFSYLENFKCSLRATLRCLAGRMWPAGRTLPWPGLNRINHLGAYLGVYFCQLMELGANFFIYKNGPLSYKEYIYPKFLNGQEFNLNVPTVQL